METEKPKRTRRAKTPGTVMSNVLRELALLKPAERHQVLAGILAYFKPPEQLKLPDLEDEPKF